MLNHTPRSFGFNLNKNSTHTARTIMLSELSTVLDWVPETDQRQAYQKAIREENCLLKNSASNREITARHLVELYGLDAAIPLFRALRFFWNRDEQARPTLALLCACARDSILHDLLPNLIKWPVGASLTKEETRGWVNARYPERFSSVTLHSVAKNLNSTWTQAGYLVGTMNKKRGKLSASPGAAAYAFFLAYISGARGLGMLDTLYVKLLDCPAQEAIALAQTASQQGWITVNRVGDVIDMRFPRLLTPQEME